MMIGRYESVLTGKRRLAVPKKFREELGKKIIVARWYEGCLVLVSETGWEKLMQKITKVAIVVTEPVRDTDRFIMGSAYELEPDDQGRVVVPAYLVEYAKIGNQAVFLGLGNRVEIWDKTAWETRESYVTANADKFIEKIASSSYLNSKREEGELN